MSKLINFKIIGFLLFLFLGAESFGQVASATLSGTKNFNRGSRNFTLVQGTSKTGWKHIYDRHVNLSKFTTKSKFNATLTQSQIINALSMTLKHGSESTYAGLPIFEYRQKIKNTYRKYRATVNTDGTVRTFHPLN